MGLVALLFLLLLPLASLAGCIYALICGVKWWGRIRQSGRTVQVSLFELIAFVLLLTPLLALVGRAREFRFATISLCLFVAFGAALGGLYLRARSQESRPPVRKAILAMVLGGVILLAVSLPLQMVVIAVRDAPYASKDLLVIQVRLQTAIIVGLKACATAQTLYFRRNGTYANKLSMLSPMLDPPIVAAGKNGPNPDPFYGYYFRELTDRGQAPLDYTQEFALAAEPSVYGQTGTLTYLTDQTNTVYQKDTGGKPVNTFPADPQAEGWVPVQ